MLLITSICSSSRALALTVDRNYLYSGNGEYRDLPQNKDDVTTVLVSKAGPILRPPLFYTKMDVVDTSIEEVTVTTGLQEVQAKAYLCDESTEICE